MWNYLFTRSPHGLSVNFAESSVILHEEVWKAVASNRI